MSYLWLSQEVSISRCHDRKFNLVRFSIMSEHERCEFTQELNGLILKSDLEHDAEKYIHYVIRWQPKRSTNKMK